MWNEEKEEREGIDVKKDGGCFGYKHLIMRALQDEITQRKA